MSDKYLYRDSCGKMYSHRREREQRTLTQIDLSIAEGFM